jgi:peptidoglycan/LPS O-acetylase OafA/YrhL
MNLFDVRRNWWIVIAATAAVGIGVILVFDQWLPDHKNIGAFLAFGLLGAAFCWVYVKNKERLWWAIIPGLGLFSLLAGVIVAALTTKDKDESSWLGVLVLGIGAVIIGLVLKRKDASLILYYVALITFITGLAMIPIDWVIRIVLIAALFVAAGILAWRGKIFSSK